MFDFILFFYLIHLLNRNLLKNQFPISQLPQRCVEALRGRTWLTGTGYDLGLTCLSHAHTEKTFVDGSCYLCQNMTMQRCGRISVFWSEKESLQLLRGPLHKRWGQYVGNNISISKDLPFLFTHFASGRVRMS